MLQKHNINNNREDTNLSQLLELLNVAEKYQILPIKQAVMEKMRMMNVDQQSIEDLLSDIGMYV